MTQDLVTVMTVMIMTMIMTRCSAGPHLHDVHDPHMSHDIRLVHRITRTSESWRDYWSRRLSFGFSAPESGDIFMVLS